jgi:hypothetical protein
VSLAEHDDELRASAFAYLDALTRSKDVVSQEELMAFEFKGQRVSLFQHMRGIRVIAGLPAALTIRTTYRRNPKDLPYADEEGVDGYYRYKWQGTDPDARDNQGLRGSDGSPALASTRVQTAGVNRVSIGLCAMQSPWFSSTRVGAFRSWAPPFVRRSRG